MDTDTRRGLRWEFASGTLYFHPVKPARFVANEIARNDLRWWRSVLRAEGLPASQKFIANDFGNFEVVGLLESLYHRAVGLEPFRAELEGWWSQLSQGQSHPIEFHPSNFWFRNRQAELDYLPGLTALYWSPVTAWSEVWEDFQRRASISPTFSSYPLEDFPEFLSLRYWYRGDPSSFAEYISRGVILRDPTWPRHWGSYPGVPRLVSPAEVNLREPRLELRYLVPLPTGPLACWSNLRRVLTLGGHSATSVAEWLNEYLSLLCWVAEQPEDLWSDFLPPYFLWEEPLGKVLPSKVVLGLFAPADYKDRDEGLKAMVLGWTRCLMFSLPLLDEAELVGLLNQLLDGPVDPSTAIHLWRGALKQTRFSSIS